MTRLELKELFKSPVAQAFVQGERIQSNTSKVGWLDITDELDVCNLLYNPTKYRIAPKPLVRWIVATPNSGEYTFDNEQRADNWWKTYGGTIHKLTEEK